MAKFFYMLSLNPVENWRSTIESLQSVIPLDSGNNVLEKTTHELLYINSDRGLSRDGFSIAGGSPYPDKKPQDAPYFSFRIINVDEQVIIQSDCTAIRAIWIARGNNCIMVSSSQLAIVANLGGFEPNKQAVSWMISRGCLSFHSWDARLVRLKAGEEIIIEKKDLSQKNNISKIPENNESLSKLFFDVFTDFQKDFPFGCTLSGGTDSRAAVIGLLKHNVSFEAFNWGDVELEEEHEGDTAIAKRVAKHLNIPFTYIGLHPPENCAEAILESFVRETEGRIDHFLTCGYQMNFWKKLRDGNIQSALRFDEPFGWLPVSTEKDVRILLDFHNIEDYKNLNALFKLSGIEPPCNDPSLERKHGETIASWRDRLYRTWRFPSINSPLSDPALTYFEVVNPLLHESLMGWAIAQTDQDRTLKRKYQKFVDELLPGIPYASKSSVYETDELIRSDLFYDRMKTFLQEDCVKELIGEEARKLLIDNFKKWNPSKNNRSSMFRGFRKWMPFTLKKLIRNTILPYEIGYGRLILRIYIVCTIHKMFDQLSRKL